MVIHNRLPGSKVVTMQMVRDKIYNSPNGLDIKEILHKLDLGYNDTYSHIIEAYLGALVATDWICKKGSKYRPVKNKKLPN